MDLLPPNLSIDLSLWQSLFFKFKRSLIDLLRLLLLEVHLLILPRSLSSKIQTSSRLKRPNLFSCALFAGSSFFQIVGQSILRVLCTVFG